MEAPEAAEAATGTEPLSGFDFTVLICTRDRPEHLEEALNALERSSQEPFPVVVVDHSQARDDRLQRRAEAQPHLRIVADEGGYGLSRARNRAWPSITSDWVVLLDDDCRVGPGWTEALTEALRAHPEVELVGCGLVADAPPGNEGLQVTTFLVAEEGTRSGRWTKPWEIGFTAFCAIRRTTIERLGGWDEQLGAGALVFPAGEDMDFNYRFLGSGGVALVTPSVTAHHDQWRPPAELSAHLGGYMKGWAGFSMKHLRQGDVAGGLWLWSLGAQDTVRMFASALRRRSSLRLRVGARKLQGLMTGTLRGLAHRW